MPQDNLCVLIDFENIAAGTEKEGLGRFNIRLVMNRLKEKGRILVTRAYGDWGRFAKFKQSLLEEGVTMMELTSYRGQEKNRADIALVVDAMELAFTREYLDTYVLLSGDSDFTPLVTRLRELNKHVIGIGTRGSTSRLLAGSCDEFMFYDNIKKRKAVTAHEDNDGKSKRNISVEQAFEMLVDTIEGMQKDHPGPVAAGIIKQSILRKHPTFDEGDYGFPGFTRFLRAASSKKLVHLLKDERAGGYQVDLFSDEEQNGKVVEVVESDLPALEGEPKRLLELLLADGFHPTTKLIRHTVVHEFVDHVMERQNKNKKNTLLYVYGDIERRCRKTDPFVDKNCVRYVINALKATDHLIHPNGGPIRSKRASFLLHKDAEELLSALREFYVEYLLKKGESLKDSEALSQLLWGDGEHCEEVEKMVSWMGLELAEDDSESSEVDIDVYWEDGDAPKSEGSEPAAADSAEESADAAAPGADSAEPAASAEESPPVAEAAEDTAPAAEAADETPADAAPEKAVEVAKKKPAKRKARKPRKPAEKTEEVAAVDKSKVVRRRKAAPKEPEETVAEDSAEK
jgi:uncharacterized LabA/DUF88 family protein